jgi:hypothetical protein
VLSTIVMALALLTGAHVVAAQSSDEAAIEQAVEAFRNAMNYAPWMAMNHRHESCQEPICGVIGTFGEIERSRGVLRYHRR